MCYMNFPVSIAYLKLIFIEFHLKYKLHNLFSVSIVYILIFIKYHLHFYVKYINFKEMHLTDNNPIGSKGISS